MYDFDDDAFADIVNDIGTGVDRTTCCQLAGGATSANDALSGYSPDKSYANISANSTVQFEFTDLLAVGTEEAGPDIIYFEGYNQDRFQLAVRCAANQQWTGYSEFDENTFVLVNRNEGPHFSGTTSPRGALIAYEIGLEVFFNKENRCDAVDAIRLQGAGADPVMAGVLNGTTMVPPTCNGGCDGDGELTVDEIIRAVAVALGFLPSSDCLGADANEDDRVTVDEVIQAIHSCG